MLFYVAHLNLPATLISHFIGKETWAQRGHIITPMSHSWVSGGSLDLRLDCDLLTVIMAILLYIVASLGLLRENCFAHID